MDLTWRLLLYLLLANLAYMIFTLIRLGWRQQLGYIPQLLAAGAVLAWPLARGEEVGGSWLLLATGLLGALVFVPWVLQRRLDNLLAEHRYDEALVAARNKAQLAWSQTNQHLVDIAEVLAGAGDDPEAAVQRLRALKGRGDLCDGLTRVHLAQLLLDQRRFTALREELRVEGRPWSEYRREELYFLLRAELELGDYDTALAIQRDLEAGPDRERPREMVLVSRLLFFAFIGAREEYERLLAEHPAVFSDFPDGLVEYWRGVAMVLAGDPPQGLVLMRQGMARAAEVNPAWQSLMQRRYDDFAGHGEALGAGLLPRLADFRARHLADFLALVAQAGAGAAELPRRQTVTRLLIWANVVVFAGLLVSGHGEDLVVLSDLGANCGFLVARGEYFRLVASLFPHLGWMHLLMNVFALNMLGPPLETQVGPVVLAGLYFTGGVCGALASAVRPAGGLSVGASGAVLGLLAAGIVLSVTGLTRSEGESRREHVATLWFILLVNLAIGWIERNIDNHAHLGGLAGGAAAALVWSAIGRLPRLAVLARAAIALGLVAGLGLAGRDWWQAVAAPGYPAAAPVVTSLALGHGLTLARPAGWRFEPLRRHGDAAGEADAGDVAVLVGPLGERLEIGLAAAGDDFAREAREFGKKQTQSLNRSSDMTLVGYDGPVEEGAGDRRWTRFTWLLRLGRMPMTFVQFLERRGRVVVMTRFIAVTAQVTRYEATLRAVLGGLDLDERGAGGDEAPAGTASGDTPAPASGGGAP